jgi:hypothetical protein
MWVLKELGMDPGPFLNVFGDVAVEALKGRTTRDVAGLGLAGTLFGHLTDLRKAHFEGDVERLKAILDAIAREKGVYGALVNNVAQIGLSMIDAHQQELAAAKQQALNAGLPEAEIAALENEIKRKFSRQFAPIESLFKQAVEATLNPNALRNAFNPGLLQPLQGLPQPAVPQPGLQQQVVPQPGLQQQNPQLQENPPPEVQPVPAVPGAPAPGRQIVPMLDPEQIAGFPQLAQMLAGVLPAQQPNAPKLLPDGPDVRHEWERAIARYQRATDALENLLGDSKEVTMDMLLKASRDGGLFDPQERAQWMVRMGAKYGLPKIEIVRALKRGAGVFYDRDIARALLRALGDDLPGPARVAPTPHPVF